MDSISQDSRSARSKFRDRTSLFEDATYKAVRRRIIPFLMMCYVVAYLDRVNIGFAKLQMAGDLNFSDSVYGMGAGIFFIGYIGFGVPISSALRHLGPQLYMAAIMLAWGTLSALMAFVSTPTQFFTLRLLLGAAEAGFYPGVVLYLSYWFPRERRAVAMSTFQTAVPLTGLIGGPLSGLILDRLDGWRGLFGWRWLFLIEALPAVLLGFVALLYLDDSVDEARWLTSAQKDLLDRKAALDAATETDSSVAHVFRDARVWLLGLLVFGLTMGVYGISFWMPTLLKGSRSLSLTEVGFLSAIPNLAPALFMILLARSSDRHRERRWHVAGSALLGAVGLACSVIFSGDLYLAVLSLALASAGTMSALPLQWTFLTAFVSGSGAAAAIALINSVGNLGGIVSPALIGWLKDRTSSFDSGMYVIALCAALSAVIALSFPARLVNK